MNELKKVLSKVLNVDPGIITDETSPKTVSSWDSFHGLMLISELEDYFKVNFTMKEVTSVKNVSDIKFFLRKHGVKIKE